MFKIINLLNQGAQGTCYIQEVQAQETKKTTTGQVIVKLLRAIDKKREVSREQQQQQNYIQKNKIKLTVYFMSEIKQVRRQHL